MSPLIVALISFQACAQVSWNVETGSVSKLIPFDERGWTEMLESFPQVKALNFSSHEWKLPEKKDYSLFVRMDWTRTQDLVFFNGFASFLLDPLEVNEFPPEKKDLHGLLAVPHMRKPEAIQLVNDVSFDRWRTSFRHPVSVEGAVLEGWNHRLLMSSMTMNCPLCIAAINGDELEWVYDTGYCALVHTILRKYHHLDEPVFTSLVPLNAVGKSKKLIPGGPHCGNVVKPEWLKHSFLDSISFGLTLPVDWTWHSVGASSVLPQVGVTSEGAGMDFEFLNCAFATDVTDEGVLAIHRGICEKEKWEEFRTALRLGLPEYPSQENFKYSPLSGLSVALYCWMPRHSHNLISSWVCSPWMSRVMKLPYVIRVSRSLCGLQGEPTIDEKWIQTGFTSRTHSEDSASPRAEEHSEGGEGSNRRDAYEVRLKEERKVEEREWRGEPCRKRRRVQGHKMNGLLSKRRKDTLSTIKSTKVSKAAKKKKSVMASRAGFIQKKEGRTEGGLKPASSGLEKQERLRNQKRLRLTLWGSLTSESSLSPAPRARRRLKMMTDENRFRGKVRVRKYCQRSARSVRQKKRSMDRGLPSSKDEEEGEELCTSSYESESSEWDFDGPQSMWEARSSERTLKPKELKNEFFDAFLPSVPMRKETIRQRKKKFEEKRGKLWSSTLSDVPVSRGPRGERKGESGFLRREEEKADVTPPLAKALPFTFPDVWEIHAGELSSPPPLSDDEFPPPSPLVPLLRDHPGAKMRSGELEVSSFLRALDEEVLKAAGISELSLLCEHSSIDCLFPWESIIRGEGLEFPILKEEPRSVDRELLEKVAWVAGGVLVACGALYYGRTVSVQRSAKQKRERERRRRALGALYSPPSFPLPPSSPPLDFSAPRVKVDLEPSQ